jgi:putative ABC transport system substrate-binding protein
LTILRSDAGNPKEIDIAFSKMRQQTVGALIVSLDPLFYQQSNRVAELAMQNRLPSISGDRMYSEAGVLMSYGPNTADQVRRTAVYVDKILKGMKPRDLPIEQPTRFELVINRRTAKTLDIKIPESLLISADKVIE